MDKNIFYRNIPKVDLILEYNEIKRLSEVNTRELILNSIRKVMDDVRELINSTDDEKEITNKINNIEADVITEVNKFISFNMKKVINGTGTILHTNLGRAVISKESIEKATKLMTGFSNLEYNLELGERGSRYSHFEKIITKITGAESAMAVNNNAAAVLLILSTFAKNKEVIVSRGELVEIGGSFRVPDIMAQSNGHLVEVGTTNKTHVYDYEQAINENTAALLKVHTSNYKIIGFTESVSVGDLVHIAHKNNIPLIEDIGSGVLIDLSKYGLDYEPTVQESIKAGADIVCFSGDKLLGGPQAGIIVGKKQYIDKIKKHPLTRALRIDKFTAACLECVFHEYIDENKAIKNVPVLKMITKEIEEIESQALNLFNKLSKSIGLICEIEIMDCESQIGGGALPLQRIKSKCISFMPKNISTSTLEKNLRLHKTPIVGRIANDKFLIDLRTIFDDEIELINQVFEEVLNI